MVSDLIKLICFGLVTLMKENGIGMVIIWWTLLCLRIYCPSNFWNNDGFDSYSVMGVYRDKENYKTLFTILKEKYIEFLKFIAEFRTHQWCFIIMFMVQKHTCTTALPYYEKNG